MAAHSNNSPYLAPALVEAMKSPAPTPVAAMAMPGPSTDSRRTNREVAIAQLTSSARFWSGRSSGGQRNETENASRVRNDLTDDVAGGDHDEKGIELRRCEVHAPDRVADQAWSRIASAADRPTRADVHIDRDVLARDVRNQEGRGLYVSHRNWERLT